MIKVLKSGIYAHGPMSNEFEKKFCKFTRSKYATTVSSCTAGMHLFYFALGIGKGDEVIVPAQTHTATAHAVEALALNQFLLIVMLKQETSIIEK